MKQITAILATGIILFFSSCGSGSGKEEKKSEDTTAAAAVAEPVFTPFKLAIIQHRVKDFDKWKAGYLAHDSVRKAYGISQFVLGRSLEDSNMVIVIDKMNDVQKAKEFSTLPSLKDAMMKAGVTGAATFSYIDVVRSDDTKMDQKDRIMVVHKVKDFDAWLKVYDAEGKAKRAENGLVDRGLGRGIDDPNMVSIVFAVTDMAKAKARIASEELKKIMTDAGVEGPPQIIYYRLVD